jgi:hypothetical protein
LAPEKCLALSDRLDVTPKEDKSRIRESIAAENWKRKNESIHPHDSDVVIEKIH